MKKSHIQHVKNGFESAFGIVAGFCIFLTLFYGLQKLDHPEVDNSLLVFLKKYPPLVVGSACVVTAVLVLWTTVQRWAKVLPGFFGYAVLGGSLAFARGGFYSAIPAFRVSRSGVALMMLCCVLCSLLTWRFSSSELSNVDRCASVAAVVAFAWTLATAASSTRDFQGLTLIVVILASAWLWDHFRQPRHRSRHAPIRNV